MRKTVTMRAVKAALDSCVELPISKERYTLWKWAIRHMVLPYIHRHECWEWAGLCEYFGISLDRYMYYRYLRNRRNKAIV